jgi:hypothetical protein
LIGWNVEKGMTVTQTILNKSAQQKSAQQKSAQQKAVQQTVRIIDCRA